MNATNSSQRPLTSDDRIHLKSGDEVIIERAGELPQRGEVDDVNEDASIFWIHLYGGRGRILVYEGDGSVVTNETGRKPASAADAGFVVPNQPPRDRTETLQ